MDDAAQRAIRTFAQFIVAGGLTALVDYAAVELTGLWLLVVLALCQLLVTWGHNELEQAGVVRPLLKGGGGASSP